MDAVRTGLETFSTRLEGHVQDFQAYDEQTSNEVSMLEDHMDTVRYGLVELGAATVATGSAAPMDESGEAGEEAEDESQTDDEMDGGDDNPYGEVPLKTADKPSTAAERSFGPRKVLRCK
eukprot:s2110_g17.t1